eukprot:5127100-Karenia_brevis.AAC.1
MLLAVVSFLYPALPLETASQRKTWGTFDDTGTPDLQSGAVRHSASHRGRKVATGLRGTFPNTGDTCYLASLCQALFHCDASCHAVMEHEPSQVCPPACALCLLKRTEEKSRLPGSRTELDFWA